MTSAGRSALDLWRRLDAAGPPTVAWPRPLGAGRVVLLLGAFDPPTDAHVDLARSVGRILRLPAAFCLTRVLLDRPDADVLLDPGQRVELLDAIAERVGVGLAFSNRGTYLEVARALSSQGWRPTFVVGADKLAQLGDSRFYEDGGRGVEATFAECDFVVVKRAGHDVSRDDVRVLAADEVFSDPSTADVSGTEVRRLLRGGNDVSGMVPPEVSLALEGYTSR